MRFPVVAVLSVLPLASANAPAFTKTMSIVSDAVYTLNDFLYSWGSKSGTESLSTFFDSWSSIISTDLVDLSSAAGNLDNLNYKDAGNVILDFQSTASTVESFLYRLVNLALDFRAVGATSAVTDSLEAFIDPFYGIAGNAFNAMDSVSCDLLTYASEIQDDLYSTVSSATDVFSASISDITGLVTTCTVSSKVSSVTGILFVLTKNETASSAAASASVSSASRTGSAASSVASSGAASGSARSSAVSESASGEPSSAAVSGSSSASHHDSSASGSAAGSSAAGSSAAGSTGAAAGTGSTRSTSSAGTGTGAGTAGSSGSTSSAGSSASASASSSSTGNAAPPMVFGYGAVFVGIAVYLV